MPCSPGPAPPSGCPARHCGSAIGQPLAGAVRLLSAGTWFGEFIGGTERAKPGERKATLDGALRSPAPGNRHNGPYRTVTGDLVVDTTGRGSRRARAGTRKGCWWSATPPALPTRRTAWMGNAYMPRLQAAAAHDGQLTVSFPRAAGLVDPPQALMRPSVASRVLRAGRQ
ncbi:hypothetical protein Sar04_16130 [Salinispora arenicola]|uniref:Uncharacterized protein n=2 Tax=Salinispora arenicola TaxID=168697 RepID=A0ABQ4JQ38_SALAC|nr:hypothetical protein Sar04_16130 [Salinispora arenicola]